RVAADQHQRGETAGTLADLLRPPGERLERSLLRHPQVEADPSGQRAEIDIRRRRAAVPVAAHEPPLACHRDRPRPSRPDLRVRPRNSLISNDPLYNSPGIRLNIAKQFVAADNIRRGRNAVMKARFTGIVCAAAVAAMIGSGAASAQEKTFDLKISHWVPPSHPLQKALEQWGADVEKESGGTIHYKVFPAQQLGKAFDHYDMARDGIADLTYINPGYQPGRFPVIAAGELPFLIANAKGGSQALDAWYRKYADKEMKDVKFCLAFVHDPGSFHSKSKKIVLPSDIKGMKIRPAHATMAEWVKQLGGTNVQSS